MTPRLRLLRARALLRTIDSKAQPARVEMLSSLARTVAILVAGVWAAAMYFSHQRAFHRLLNEHQRLVNQQMSLTVKQSIANADYDLARARLAAETATLQNQISRLQIRDLTASGVIVSHTLRIKLVNQKTSAYAGEFEITVQNPSKSRVEVSWALFELYVGQLAPQKGETITFINPPPKRELEQEQRGPVSWTHQGSYGYLYPDSKLLDYSSFEGSDYYQTGGGPTKSLGPGDACSFRLPLFITTPRDRWIAVVAILGIDGATEGPDIFSSADWTDLREATVHTAAVVR